MIFAKNDNDDTNSLQVYLFIFYLCMHVAFTSLVRSFDNVAKENNDGKP